MRFDVNRLSVLAGIPAAKTQRLSEASNRSMHEDPALAGEADHRFGKGQLAEGEHEQNEEADHHRAVDHYKEGADSEAGPEEGKEVVYEVDEQELKEELMRLRRMARRKNAQKLQEAQLKQIIEQEVQNVFKDLEEGKLNLNISGDWVYGDNKPRNSRRGRIARGFKSIGFK